METTINRRVLVVDDNSAIHADFRKILAPSGPATDDFDASEAAVFGDAQESVQQTQFLVDSAYQGEEGVRMVEEAKAAGQPYAIAFVDVRMPPGLDGVETTRRMWEIDPDLQIILCAAYSDYSWAEMFAKLGQHDGLLILKKPFDAVEAFQMAHALTEKWWLRQQTRRKVEDLESEVLRRTAELQRINQTLTGEIAERQRTEETLRASEEKFRQLAASIDDVFWMTSPDLTQVHYVSPAYEKVWGRPVESVYAHPAEWGEAILPEYREAVLHAFTKLAGKAPSVTVEYQLVRPDGAVRWISDHGFQVRDETGQVIRFTGISRDITEQKTLQAEMDQLRNEYAIILNALGEGVHWVDQHGRIKYENPAAAKMLGYEPADLLGQPAHTTMHHTRREGTEFPVGECSIYATLRDGLVRRVTDEVFWRKDGTSFPVEYLCTPAYDPDGNSLGSVVVFTDITQRQQLETQLFQSQKMETVGKLAGGIAHEFNSILTAIVGQSELLLNDLPAGSSLSHSAMEISKAAGRAATLTRQLLAYGRKQFLQPEALDLHRVLAGMEAIFQQILGRDVETRIVHGPGVHAVRADLGQIEQVIMNLAVNAREAMPHGGKLTLETANVTIDSAMASHYGEIKPNEYVMLAITDTGTGMTPEVKARAFEPFFSTKGLAEGTGLGLSTSYGIIKQSGGHISVSSEPGRGTVFKIYLPQAEVSKAAQATPARSLELPGGSETILLVEDDPALREMASTLLGRLGYKVLTAGNGVDALSITQRSDCERIDLLFTDLVMPQMDGNELAARVRASNPEMRILFTSAYTENAILHQGVLEPGVLLLQKPFTPSAMARKLRDLLDSQL